MSKENFQKYWDFVNINTQAAKKLVTSGTNPTIIKELGQENGFDFNVEDIKSFSEEHTIEIKKFLEKIGSQLSDNELAKITGGINFANEFLKAISNFS